MVLLNSGFSEWDVFWQRYNPGVNASWSKRRIMSIISDYIKPDMDILDAGCGTGFFSSYFISRGCNVYSLDYSEKAFDIAKVVTNYKSKMYIKADILDAKALTGFNVKFDIIFTDGLLEHYSREEQDVIVCNMKAIKKDMGCVINFAPNRFSLWSGVRPFIMDIKERPFVMSRFIDLHRRNGLRVISYGGINTFPFRISPERLLAKYFGMLFYCIAV